MCSGVDGACGSVGDGCGHLLSCPCEAGAITTFFVADAGSRWFALGYGQQLHVIHALVDQAYWLFYLDDTAGVIKAARSPDGTSWSPAGDISLPAGPWTMRDGYSFSVAYEASGGQDFVHVVANVAATDGGAPDQLPFQTFHIRTPIMDGVLGASTSAVLDRVLGGVGAPCPNDGPATIVTSSGVYDVTAWIQRELPDGGFATCQNNVYSAAADLAGGFSPQGYFVAQPAPGYNYSHQLIDLHDGGLMLLFPDQPDPDHIFDFQTMGWVVSSGLETPLDGGDTPSAELFAGAAYGSLDDWAACWLSDDDVQLVRHAFDTRGTPEVVWNQAEYTGATGGWTSLATAALGGPSPENVGLALMTDTSGNMLVASVAIDAGTGPAVQVAQQSSPGVWTVVWQSPGAAASLVGSGCGGDKPLVFWTETVGQGYVIMGADLSKL
jgi:hypothetical protein